MQIPTVNVASDSNRSQQKSNLGCVSPSSRLQNYSSGF